MVNPSTSVWDRGVGSPLINQVAAALMENETTREQLAPILLNARKLKQAMAATTSKEAPTAASSTAGSEATASSSAPAPGFSMTTAGSITRRPSSTTTEPTLTHHPDLEAMLSSSSAATAGCVPIPGELATGSTSSSVSRPLETTSSLSAPLAFAEGFSKFIDTKELEHPSYGSKDRLHGGDEMSVLEKNDDDDEKDTRPLTPLTRNVCALEKLLEEERKGREGNQQAHEERKENEEDLACGSIDSGKVLLSEKEEEISDASSIVRQARHLMELVDKCEDKEILTIFTHVLRKREHLVEQMKQTLFPSI